MSYIRAEQNLESALRSWMILSENRASGRDAGRTQWFKIVLPTGRTVWKINLATRHMSGCRAQESCPGISGKSQEQTYPWCHTEK